MGFRRYRTIRPILASLAIASSLTGLVRPAPAWAGCVPGTTNGDDVIVCDGASDTVNALDGNDSVQGSGGNDTINGGNGNDTLDGGTGNDGLTGAAGNDTLIGGAGNDTFSFNTNSSLGSDTVTEASGGGTDALNFAGSSNGIALNLGTTGSQVINANLTLTLTAAQIENATGGNGSDVITGNDLANSLTGGSGNDSLDGAAGNDTLTGNAGNDTLVGGVGNDTYAFNSNSALGSDIVVEASAGGTDALTFSGSSNAVTIDLGLTSAQTVNGNLTLTLASTQVENATGGNGNDVITGNALNNSLTGGSGDDTLNGAAGNDTLTGNAGADTLVGGSGNDTYAFNTNSALGTDTVTEAAGGGTDGITFSGSNNAVTLNLSVTGAQIVNGNLILNLTSAELENATGGNGNDSLTGTSLANTLSGGNGNDALTGGGGNDTLSGDAGNDILDGGAGNDTLTGGAGDDDLIGGAGNDTYAFNTNSALGTDNVTEAAGGDTDALTFSGSTGAITVNLGTSGSQIISGNLTLILTPDQVENATGGNGNDVITGNSLSNTLSGGNGNDMLLGAGGNDTLTGGAGSDTLTGGADNDTYAFNTNSALGTDTVNELAGEGTDTLTFAGSTGALTVNLSLTSSQVVNGNLTLILTAPEVENLTGGSANDSLSGNALANNISGGSGNDTLLGADGFDTLYGDAGNDVLQGGTGNDGLTGGAGNDTLTGNGGDDRFLFNTSSALGTDTVNEALGEGTDTLDFTGSTNAITLLLGAAGNQVVNGNLILNLAGSELENVLGGSGSDSLTGNALGNSLSGAAGNDALSGSGGDDTLVGGAGNDTLAGGLGNDVCVFTTTTPLGVDTLSEVSGQGSDGLDFSGSSLPVVVDLRLLGNQLVNTNLTLNFTAAEFENVWGGNGDDALTGNASSNLLSGGSGDDTLRAEGGDDTLDGGSGTDTVLQSVDADQILTATSLSGQGLDTLTSIERASLTGGVGDNLLDARGFPGISALNGGGGNDLLAGGSGDDTLAGGAGNDTYLFDTDSPLGSDVVTEAAGGGIDLLDFSGSSNPVILNLAAAGAQTVNPNLSLQFTPMTIENLAGGTGDDDLSGSDADNTIDGGDGSDAIRGAGGNDWLAGGSGDDALLGDNGNDTLLGGDGSDSLNGGAGDDALFGEEGDDTLWTSDGVDTLDAGDGDDTLNIEGTHSLGDTLTGGPGTNAFRFSAGTRGTLVLISDGDDSLDFSLFDVPLHVDLSLTTEQDVGDGLLLTLKGAFETVIGTLFGDNIRGNADPNEILASDGDDLVDGGGGVDLLDGGEDSDTVVNHEAQDTHLNIEAGFPSPSARTFPASGAAWILISVADGELVPLSCEVPVTRLRLPSSNQVDFHGLCGYMARIGQRGATHLPIGIQPGLEFRSSLQIEVFHGDALLEVLPPGAQMTVSFPEPLIGRGTRPTILFFDGTSGQEDGSWVVLQAGQLESSPLSAGDGEADRLVLGPTQAIGQDRVEVGVNFPGLFALATEGTSD